MRQERSGVRLAAFVSGLIVTTGAWDPHELLRERPDVDAHLILWPATSGLRSLLASKPRMDGKLPFGNWVI